MPYKNRVRLPMMFVKPQYPMERNTFRLADGTTKVLSIVIRNTFEGKTDQLPEAWHRKLVIALAHDTVTIENERLLSDVVLDGDYGIDWIDFLNNPVAPASFNVQVTPFDATNSNCQTCEEISQVVLVDDITTDIWSEGTTNIFPDVLTDNDSICCHPFTIELVSYNTLYFTSVTISAAGVLTATVIDPAPIISDVWIATYRVTCSDGNYDEADIYGNITGSDVSFCTPPVGPLVISDISSTSVDVSWDVAIPPPTCGWAWELYLTSDLGTIIQSGSVIIPDIILTGLTAGVDYTILVKSDCCAYDYSTSLTESFSITAFASESCGSFTVTYIPNIDAAPQSISYMDCAGSIINKDLAFAQVVTICMLILPGATTPLYFVASSADISIIYVDLC